MPKRISATVEEYLETIYRLQERSGVARTSDLVVMLEVAPGTVTNTIDRLERDLLVIHKPYKGVQLTDRGRKIAISVIRRHRLLECLLADFLGVEWEKSHEIACSLEHWISEDIAKKIERVLNYPKTCPHGNPIPTELGEIIEEGAYPLTMSKVGEKVIIAKIIEEKPEFLRYFSKLGIRPKKQIEIVDKGPLNDPIAIKIDGKVQALNRKVASSIMIRRIQI